MDEFPYRLINELERLADKFPDYCGDLEFDSGGQYRLRRISQILAGDSKAEQYSAKQNSFAVQELERISKRVLDFVVKARIPDVSFASDGARVMGWVLRDQINSDSQLGETRTYSVRNAFLTINDELETQLALETKFEELLDNLNRCFEYPHSRGLESVIFDEEKEKERFDARMSMIVECYLRLKNTLFSSVDLVERCGTELARINSNYHWEPDPRIQSAASIADLELSFEDEWSDPDGCYSVLSGYVIQRLYKPVEDFFFTLRKFCGLSFSIEMFDEAINAILGSLPAFSYEVFGLLSAIDYYFDQHGGLQSVLKQYSEIDIGLEEEPPEKFSSEEQTELDRLENETPLFNRDNGQWVKSKKAAEIEYLETKTLSQYRLKGIKNKDGSLGNDQYGRVWRRPGTPQSHPWYLKSSLKNHSD